MRTIAILCLIGILCIGVMGCFGNTGIFIASGTGLGIGIGATPVTPNLVILGGDFNLAVVDVDAAQEAITVKDNTFYDAEIVAGVGEGADAAAIAGKRREFKFTLAPVVE